MILKIITIAMIMAVMAIYTAQAMAAEDQVEKYKAMYDGLCNVQVNNNIKADLPHATMNISMDNGANARISAQSIEYVQNNQAGATFSLNISADSSKVAYNYEF